MFRRFRGRIKDSLCIAIRTVTIVETDAKILPRYARRNDHGPNACGQPPYEEIAKCSDLAARLAPTSYRSPRS
jgi:hypothetical protein